MTTRVLPVPLVHQGETPFCTYASVAMVLQYFGISKSLGDVISEVTIPDAFTEIDTGMPSPTGMARIYQSYAVMREYFQDQGLEARLLHGQDFEEIRANIRNGNPIIVSVIKNKRDHSWVIRGYIDDAGNESIIYNDPNDHPTGNAIIFDPTDPPDGNPGRTIRYDEFVQNHWHDEIPMSDRKMLVISVKGMGVGEGTTFDWRGSGARTYQAFLYHATKFIDRAMRGEFFGATVEGTLTFVGLAAVGISFTQQIGQNMENYGQELIEKGGWAAVAGYFIRTLGTIIDSAAGIAGLTFEWGMDLIDTVGEMFDGNSSGGRIRTIDDIDVVLMSSLNVRPWKSRWGHNWENISGYWGIVVPSAEKIDIEVSWYVVVVGLGVDDWNLARHVNFLDGSLDRNNRVSNSNYLKSFVTEASDVSLFYMGFGEDRCNYGRDGWLITVRLKVDLWATHGGVTRKISKSQTIIGYSA